MSKRPFPFIPKSCALRPIWTRWPLAENEIRFTQMYAWTDGLSTWKWSNYTNGSSLWTICYCIHAVIKFYGRWIPNYAELAERAQVVMLRTNDQHNKRYSRQWYGKLVSIKNTVLRHATCELRNNFKRYILKMVIELGISSVIVQFAFNLSNDISNL